jgi:hypothetical protein
LYIADRIDVVEVEIFTKNLERKGDEVIGTPLLPSAMQQKDRPVL